MKATRLKLAISENRTLATSDRTPTSSSLPRAYNHASHLAWPQGPPTHQMGESERHGILLVGFAHLPSQCLDVEASGQARDRSGIRRESCCMLITTRHFGGGSDFFCLQTCRPMEFITMASSDVFGLQACRPMECIPSAIHISTGLSDVGTRVGALRYPRLSSH